MGASHDESQQLAVMIVDDDMDIRESIAEVLQDEGYIAYVAANGKEAIEQLTLEVDEPMPIVILLDMMMPVMDGRAFIKETREMKQLAGIPIVVFSAHADLREAALELGVAGCLKKPLRREQLVETVAGFKTSVEVSSGNA